MRRLFHLTGRAWAFIGSHLASDNFVLSKCSDVPQFLHTAQRELAPRGPIRCIVRDITGCFPNMPKAAIELAMTSELHKLENLGHGGVCVPKRGSQACCFSTRTKPGTVWFSFEDLINVVNFALHNTLLTDLDGNLWRQRDGVPMGDPHSPGITITTCAWMEDEWLTTVAPAARQHFQTKRFMDDLLTVYTDGCSIDTAQLLDDQCQQCYWPPLTLEDGHQGTFLETSYR
jgi:hypothetical protein